MQAGGVAPLALERLIFDQLEAAIDPNAAQSFRRIEQGARRDYCAAFLIHGGICTNYLLNWVFLRVRLSAR